MPIDMQQFHQTFFEESFEGLDVMETALLDLQPGAADSDVINTIFRAAHSIKGGAGTFGFSAVANFTHVMETLLDEMRDGTRPVTQQGVDVLLQSVDCVRDMLNAVKDGSDADEAHIADIHAQLESILKGGGAVTAAAHTPPEQSPEIPGATAADKPEGWKIVFTPHVDMLRTGNDPVRMFRVLADLGELRIEADLDQLPPFDELQAEDSYLSWKLILKGDIAESEIAEIFEWVEDDADMAIIPIMPESAMGVSEAQSSTATPTQAPAQTSAQPPVEQTPTDKAPSTKPKASKSGGETTSIRVGIDKVDEIINLVGELVITQSMLSQMGSDTEENVVLTADRVEKLREGLAQLERNTRELQESVMRIRMLPISFVFSRVPRLVHDLSSKLGKKVELVLSGEQTELDKTVMEKIGDPLVHLVRNSLDHGIEGPDKRRAAGKPETGTLHLNAYHQGGNIVIEIKDDGAGLNRDKIMAKAIERGLVNAGESISDERVNDLIFMPGFSTADQVSDVSGRGVGMDVVRRNIKALGGNIEVISQPGQGSTFRIRLPLTLAILDGQLVRVGAQTYVTPLVSIIESLQVRREQINIVAGKAEVYKLRDEYIPIIRLYETFGVTPDNTELVGGLMVVVEGDGHKAGLIVDDLLAQQQVVIKSLESNYRRIEGLSGATILGDGTVALILDIPGLIGMFRDGGSRQSAPNIANAAA